MKSLWSLSLLCLFLETVESAETFLECFDCLALIPQAFVCMGEAFVDGSCNAYECVWKDGSPDLDRCGCTPCIETVHDCMVDCLPDCLDSSATAYAQCLTNPSNECYEQCKGDRRGNLQRFPGLNYPDEPCTLEEWLLDFHQCVPSWATCEQVENTVIEGTCKYTECCDTCHPQKLAIENCIYNYISGRECSFQCHATESRSLQSEVNGSEEPAYVQECDAMLSSNLVFQPNEPNVAFDDYMECIMSHSMELASAEPDPSGAVMMADLFIPAAVALLVYALV